MKKITTQEMTSGPLLGPIIRYTIPIVLTGVLQLLFNAADLVVVGQFCGSNSVAAVGATSSLVNLIVNLFIGLSVGAGVAVAQSLGAHNGLGATRTVHTAIPVAIIGGALVTVVGVFFSPTFLKWMGTPGEIRELASVYLRIYFAGMIFNLLYNYGAAILRAAGDTQSPLLYLTLAGVLNVVLNLFFVIVLHMNVAGVALATAISQVLSAILILRALMKRTDACKLVWKKIGIHRAPLMQMLRIGLPAGIQGSIFSISNVLIQSSVNLFGQAAIAGNAAAANLEGFVYIAMNAVYQTVLNFTGQNVGAGNYARVRKIFHTCLLLVIVLGGALGGLLYLFGEPLLSVYINDSPTSIQYGMLRLGNIGLIYFLCGIMEVTTGGLRGMGVSVASMISSVFGVCGLRIGWILTVFQIPEYHTMKSLYFSYCISWIFTFLVQAMIFYIILHKRKKKYA